jgi:phage major head subunit gpT-like protein
MANYQGFDQYTNLALALRAVWTRQFVIQSAVQPLYNIQSSTGAAERTRGLESLGDVPEYTGTIEYDEFGVGDLKTYTHKSYASGIRITREEIDDNEVNLMQNKVRLHAESYSRTVARHLAATFNNAFSTSGDGATAADGRALCASSGRNSGKAVLNNAGTSALTADAVNDTRKEMRKFKDSRGQILPVNPDTLVVPSGLENKADAIVNSDQTPGTANNDINFNRSLNSIVEPLLTDDYNWFLVDSRLANLHLNWFWRVQPEFAEDPASDYELEMRMRGYMRYSFGADASYWIYGHEVTGG